MRVLRWVGVGVILLAGTLLLWPAPIESSRFDQSGLAPPFPENRDLAEACEVISEGEIPHSDKLVVDEQGRVFAGDDQGVIHVLEPDDSGAYRRRVYAEPGGRPMELVFDASGRMIGADHHGTHFAIELDGSVTRFDTLQGLEIGPDEGTAGVAVASDGVLYYGVHPAGLIAGDRTGFMEMLAADESSELRAFDPKTGKERTLVAGLFRPVGVELSKDEDFVVVAEFFANRITRHWLRGPKAGTTDRLVENLPGVVDGLASDGRGTFYVSMPAYSPPSVEWLHDNPWAKDQLAKVLPMLLSLGLGPKGGAGIVFTLDEEGRVGRTFQDPAGEVVSTLTTAEVHRGDLYVGSIAGDRIARCRLDLP